MLYNAIVASIARKNFERVNRKEYDAILKDCAPNIHHRFGGQHALGGQRTTKEGFRRWLERLGRLSPDMVITATDVWVKGWPWNTYIIIRWHNTDKAPDGSKYVNHGVHVVQMKWFKVVDIDANEDSQAVVRNLELWRQQGNEEASAPPIIG